jgi:hypothetical protein
LPDSGGRLFDIQRFKFTLEGFEKQAGAGIVPAVPLPVGVQTMLPY